jgi:hypothetical protein
MSDTVLVAIIAAVPPTLAAFAALWQARRLARPLDEVNAAVNHRKPGERRLVELVEDIRDEVQQVRDELAQHRAYHRQIEEENGE